MVTAKIARQVQFAVQRSIFYRSTAAWEIAIVSGDCNGYSLAKRQRLLQLGVSVDFLHLCYCRTETGEAHLVLAVDTEDKGTLILDNRYDEVQKRQFLNYCWVAIEDQGLWYHVEN